MSDLTSGFWNKIGDVNADAFGIGVFGEGGIYEVGYRHYNEVKNLKKLIKFKKDMNVLELGCGAGRFAISIAPMVNKYVGVDYSEKGIQLARKNAFKSNINNTEFIQDSIINFKCNEKFDVIYFGSVLQYLKDDEIEVALKNLKKYIKEETIIVDRSSIYNNIRHIEDSILYHCIYRTPKEIENLFSNINYKLIHRKRSYNFLTCGVFMTKYIEKNYKYKKFIYYIMQICSSVFNKVIYNDKTGNYFSHDFFVFKGE